MLTRGLFLPHDVIALLTLHMVSTLHNVVNDAKFDVVETGPHNSTFGWFRGKG